MDVMEKVLEVRILLPST